MIYLNRLKPPLFITLLSSAYSLKLFSECKKKRTEGTQDMAAEAGTAADENLRGIYTDHRQSLIG